MAFGVVGAAVQSANAASSRVFYEVERFRKKAEIRQGGFEKNGRIITKISGNWLERYQKEAFKEHY